MAGNRLTISTGNTPIETGTAAKTILLLKGDTIAGSQTIRLKVDEISVSFRGTAQGDAPVLVEVLRFNSNGTGGSNVTPKRLSLMSLTGANNDAIRSEGKIGPTTGTWTAEPTTLATDETVMVERVHPQTGFTWQARFGNEIHVPPGGFLGIRVTAAVNVVCAARMNYEE